ncbi:hypothetical protein BST61_g4155 [Cercospora zeina]
MSSAVAFWTANLYGIIVTQESFLKGARTFVKAQLEREIVARAAGPQVAPELLAPMLAEAEAQARAAVEEMRRQCTTDDGKLRKFAFWQLQPGSDQSELMDITSLGVDAIPITKQTAANTTNFQDGEARHTSYVVLSPSAQHPQTIELLGRPINHSTRLGSSVIYAGERGFSIARQFDHEAAPHVKTDNVGYYYNENDDDDGTPSDGNVANDYEPSLETQRIVQMRGVKELQVIPLDPANPMEPEIMQAQRVYAR